MRILETSQLRAEVPTTHCKFSWGFKQLRFRGFGYVGDRIKLGDTEITIHVGDHTFRGRLYRALLSPGIAVRVVLQFDEKRNGMLLVSRFAHLVGYHPTP